MSNMQTESTILQVPIEDIIPNRFQPRLAFDDDSLKDLSSSIKQHGIIQPLVLRRKNDKYEIIAGERRYKAAKMAGLVSVPAIISNMDDNTSAEVAIVENIQRKDLTAIEGAKSYQALLDKGYMTQEELARKMGLSQSAISNKLRLLTLDESVQEAILQEKISERHARTLLKIASHERQRELLEKIIKERITVRGLEELLKKEEMPKPETKEEIMLDNNLEKLEEKEDINMEEMYSNPEIMPNKFFNFLEGSAANMDFEDESENFDASNFADTLPSVDELFVPTDEVEMLDDFLVTEKQSEKNYLIEVKAKINNLDLDLSRVEIIEKEDEITIKIKKEEN